MEKHPLRLQSFEILIELRRAKRIGTGAGRV